MEGFKPFKKVAAFKEGGSVQKQIENFTKRDRKSVEPADTAEDKAIVKKAFGQHDKAKHGGSEPTEIKLKKGGRAKKEIGNIKKFAKAAAPSGAKGPDKFKCGGKVKKYAMGGDVMDAIGGLGTQLKNNVMGTPEQNRIAQAQMDKVKARKAAEAAALLQGQGPSGALEQGALAGGLGGAAPMPSAPQGAPTAPMPQPSVAPQGVGAGLTPMKKGGKAKKSC